jgi:ribosomal protein S25
MSGTQKGSQHHKAKLTEEDVIAIRRDYSWHKNTHYMLAAKYGVNHATIGKILRRENWKHLK